MIIELKCPNCKSNLTISNHNFETLADEYECRHPQCPHKMTFNEILDKYFFSRSLSLMKEFDLDFKEIYNDYIELKNKTVEHKYSEIFEILFKYKHKGTLFKSIYMLITKEQIIPDDVTEMQEYFKKNKQLTIFDVK